MTDQNKWKNWREMPRWQGCLLYSALGFLALMVLVAIFAPEPDKTDEIEPAAFVDEAEKDAIRKIWKQTSVIADQCDEAAKKAADGIEEIAAGSGDVYSVFSTTSQAKDECQATWLGMGEIEVEGLSSDREEKVEDALADCKVAYFAKKEALELQMEILDGDMRPSQIDDFRKEAEFAQQGILACTVDIVSVAAELDVNLTEGEEKTE